MLSLVEKDCKITHQNKVAIAACLLLAVFIRAALLGISKFELLSQDFISRSGIPKGLLTSEFDPIMRGSDKTLKQSELPETFKVSDILINALWAFQASASFEEGMISVVNMGGDTDTTGAVFGQLAGAYYGANAIPERWQKIDFRAEIEEMSLKLEQMTLSRE